MRTLTHRRNKAQHHGHNRAKFKMTALHRSCFLVGVWEESIDHVATLPLLGAAARPLLREDDNHAHVGEHHTLQISQPLPAVTVT